LGLGALAAHIFTLPLLDHCRFVHHFSAFPHFPASSSRCYYYYYYYYYFQGFETSVRLDRLVEGAGNGKNNEMSK
jgi:hypothetical protein